MNVTLSFLNWFGDNFIDFISVVIFILILAVFVVLIVCGLGLSSIFYSIRGFLYTNQLIITFGSVTEADAAITNAARDYGKLAFYSNKDSLNPCRYIMYFLKKSDAVHFRLTQD
jgi:hypothetical protein